MMTHCNPLGKAVDVFICSIYSATTSASCGVGITANLSVAVIRKQTQMKVRVVLVLALTIAFGACASTTIVEVTQPLEKSADAPYRKVLVLTLFDSFDARRYLEDEIVRHLAEQGTTAVASTSMMNTKTPLVRRTFIDMLDEIGADSLLLTQLTAHRMDVKPNKDPTSVPQLLLC